MPSASPQAARVANHRSPRCHEVSYRRQGADGGRWRYFESIGELAGVGAWLTSMIRLT